MRPAGGEAEVRVFFALWPDARCADRLQSLAEDFAGRLGGRPTQRETLHLTLAFVGNVSVGRLPRLLAMAGRVAGEARRRAPADSGTLSLERLGYWRHQRILWAGTDVCPPALQALADRLSEKSQALGIAVPPRPFAPHVTLVRGLARAPAESELDLLQDTPLVWPWRKFVLVRSRHSSAGSSYERLAAWPLWPDFVA